MKQLRFYAKKSNLKPSFCYYKRWGVKKKDGHKPVIPLRFSKSRNPEIEKAYATHYVDLGRTEQLKKEEMKKTAVANQIGIPDQMDMPGLKKLYVFPYPFRDGWEKPLYFSFKPTESALEEMRKYVERKLKETPRINERNTLRVSLYAIRQ